MLNSRDKGPDHHRDDILRREIINYLGDAPRELLDQGPDYAPTLILNLGKCLHWISPFCDHGHARVVQPVEEIPSTVYALGKQLWQLGIKFYDHPFVGSNKHLVAFLRQREDRLSGELCEIQKRLDTFEKKRGAR